MKAAGPKLAASLLAIGLLLSSSTQAWSADEGEPLPQGAPTEPYLLAAWCYGAMSEYLTIYDTVKPDLKDIDRLFGTSVKNEPEPYASDIAAARDELKVLGKAVTAAEQASAQVIAPQGVEAVKFGRSIWTPVEEKTRRELARAWLSWALPDRCDANARELTSKSALLGQVLKSSAGSATDPAPPPPEAGASATANAPAPDTAATNAPATASPAPAADTPAAAPTPADPPADAPVTAPTTPPQGRS